MNELIAKHRHQIGELCRKHSVRRLELFGSAARGEFNPAKSDLDFFVEFAVTESRGASDRYFGLLHGLEDLFSLRIDLVDRVAIRSKTFLEEAQLNLKPIYDVAMTAKAS